MMRSPAYSALPGNAYFAPGRSDKDVQPHQSASSVPALLVISVLLLPYSVAVYLGDLKLTPIKILIVSLFFPAACKLLMSAAKRQRRLLAADAFAFGVFLLMFLGPLVISGARDFVSAFSQALEFYGMYVIARAYIFELTTIAAFMRGVQMVTIAVVAIGALDILLQRYVAWDLADMLFPATGGALDISEPKFHRTVMGFNSLRATSTFDHPILFGSFCAMALPLFLYAPMRPVPRYCLVAVSISGSLMALSSAPLLALVMVLAIHCYDRLLKRKEWRWKVLLTTLASCVLAFSIASDNPLSWLFRNLTLDPQTAYFRLLIWEAGLDVIGNNPWLGVGFNASGNRILDASTDSLLLARAINFGIPMVGLLYAMSISAMIPARGAQAVRQRHPVLDATCTSLSLTLSTILFISITVTFWNAAWLFFALCIGLRVSLKEHCLLMRRETVPSPAAASGDVGHTPLAPYLPRF